MKKNRLTGLILLLCIYLPVNADSAKPPAIVIDLKFITIPAGEYTMGTTDLNEAIADLPRPGEEIVDDETPAHTVIFKHPFKLSQTPVTQEIWFDIMGTKPGPKFHWQHKNWQKLPVVGVSWYGAMAFIYELNQTSSDTVYRLPTEAEWEYAARAGSTGLRPFSLLAMDEHAWYIHNSNDEVQPVAQLEPNAWGLYDMYGNVWEWVSDWYSPTAYADSVEINPRGPEQGSKKVRRGGSFHCPPHLIRPAYRANNTPEQSYSVLGFRLASDKKKSADKK